jgi:hypothetical protein
VKEESKNTQYLTQQAQLRIAFMKGGGSPEEAEERYPRYQSWTLQRSVLEFCWVISKTIWNLLHFRKVWRNKRERNRVISICKKCEHYKKQKCELCKCKGTIASWFTYKSCPLNKWDAKEKPSISPQITIDKLFTTASTQERTSDERFSSIESFGS